MVQPLTSTAGALPANLATHDIERPILPEPAVQVTGAAAVVSGGSASTGQESATSNAGPDDALEQINRQMQAWSTGLRFDMDPQSQRLVVSIIETATGEVLRTVPSDAVLRVARMIVQLQGLSVSTKV